MRLAATVLTAATTFKRTGPAISKPRPVCAVMIRTECTGLIGQFFICCSGQVLSCVKMHLLGGGQRHPILHENYWRDPQRYVWKKAG